jgi:hypothetical protein
MDVKNITKKRNRKFVNAIVLIAVFLVPVLFWAGSVAKCEILTSLHSEEFRDGYLAVGWIENPERCKVLNYSGTYAKVYYVEAAEGTICEFKKADGAWELDWWDTTWSAMGSADGSVWPYVWDSSYGRFQIIILAVIMLIFMASVGVILRKSEVSNEEIETN